jgi:hypothetical protein
MRPEARADVRHPPRAELAVIAPGLHLDELVGLQRPVDLGEHAFREPLVADEDDGLQLVRLGAQLAAPAGGE